MSEDIVHLGNANMKRKFSACGAPRNMLKDSVEPEKVNCIPCIKHLLGIQGRPNSKTNRWVARLQQLESNLNKE